MDRRVVVVLAAILATVSACSSDSDSEPVASTRTEDTTTTETAPSTTAAPSTESVTSADGETIEALTPPPASYDEVASDFAATRDTVLGPGRAVVDLFLNQELEALHARFAPEFAELVSVEDLRTGYGQLEGQAPLGSPRLERGAQLGPLARIYAVEIEWGDGVLALTASFDESDVLTGLLLSPQPALPPDPAAGFESAARFQLPFEGLWFTFWGGDTAIENYHVSAPVQRHAFDFVVWKDGATHAGDGSDLDDYWAYGQPVLAPAAGIVVTVVDGLPDQVPRTGSDPANPAGNHVIIEAAPGEYVLIAHLQPGSVRVARGDEIQSGQQIGLVGNSGTTTEPHIHIHLQDSPVFTTAATGLPLVFSDYVANGVAVERDQPLADQFVAGM